MKKVLFISLIALLGIFTSCKDDSSEPAGKPGPVTITATVTDNVVSFHAEATDAVKYVWDLANGQTPEGQDVTGTYSFPGTYTVKCTAQGRDDNTVGTKDIVVTKGDTTIFTEVNLLLSGYDAATGENKTTWVWAHGDWNMSCGNMSHDYDTCYFNATGEVADESVYDDVYQFKLNASMEYVNNFGTGFMVNWMWANVNFNFNPDIWCDSAYVAYEAPTASWSVEHIDNFIDADSLQFQTNINGTMHDGVYVIHLTNNAYMGVAAAGHDYQICKYANDTLLLRYDNHVPVNIGDYYDAADLDGEGITAGEK